MKKIGLFYSANAVKTSQIAKKIRETFGAENMDIIPVEKAGAVLVGFTPTDDYSFNQSRALRDGKWCGLVIDIENQSKMTDRRIKEWCVLLKKEF